MKTPYPDAAPNDYSVKAQYMKLSPEWFGIVQALIPRLEIRALWENMSDSQYDQLIDWIRSIMTPVEVEEGVIEVGTVIQSGAGSPPSGYLACDGAAIDRTTYAALFAAIGTKFGSGNGTTTFNVPDMRNKFAKGANTEAERGNTGGAASVTLTVAQIPPHHHSVALWNSSGSVAPVKPLAVFGLSLNTTNETSDVGGGQSHENEPPFVKLMHYIKF